MSYFEDASLVYIPSAVKNAKTYSIKPTDGSGDLTFSRASNATRVNSSGLVERVRENLILQSNSFNTTWAFSGTGTVTTGATDPFGGTTAWTLAKTAANTFIYQSTSSFSGSNTFSIYAKAGTVDQLWINHAQSGAFSSFFNLTLGTAFGAAGCVPTIVSVGGGWFRCSIAGTVTSPINLRIYPASGGLISGTTGSILIYAAQGETGDIATDYIATTTTAVSVGPVSGLPRLDYSGGASCPSLLLEGQRTNLVQFSESLNNSSSWSLSRTSAFGSGSVVNAIASPDGYTNAEYIQQATGETDGGGCFQGISYTSGTTYTLSAFAKKGENRYARIGFGIGSGGAGIFCGFDLQDGIVGTPDSGITAKIENYGNGWYRCSITATAQITGARNTFVYQSSNLNTFVTTPLQGIYVWGAQLEAGAYATSYIPTLSSAVTRVADAASKTGISSLIGQTEGTLFAEVELEVKPESGSPVVGILTTNNNVADLQNCIILGVERNSSGTNKIYCLVQVSNVTQAALFGPSIASGTYKIALAYKANDFVLYVNGVQVATDASGSVPTTSQVLIGTRRNADNFTLADRVSQALLFTSRLSNADLATLTA